MPADLTCIHFLAYGKSLGGFDVVFVLFSVLGNRWMALLQLSCLCVCIGADWSHAFTAVVFAVPGSGQQTESKSETLLATVPLAALPFLFSVQ